MSDYPDNTDRARWARVALRAFAQETGQGNDMPTDGYSDITPEVFGEIAGDLVCDLMHYADMIGVDPESILYAGQRHHAAEKHEWPEV